jgi:hypothetical protein
VELLATANLMLASMTAPVNQKIYHIVHADRLASIIRDDTLWCDSIMQERAPEGTAIGIENIKSRRRVLQLTTKPKLNVGDCVPFFFCARSVMLYVLFKGELPSLPFKGQDEIVHLEFDLIRMIAWATSTGRHWCFTKRNAAARPLNDCSDISKLSEIDWRAVEAHDWQRADLKEGKQAELLVESSVPFSLVESIGVKCSKMHTLVTNQLNTSPPTKPRVMIKRDWYY